MSVFFKTIADADLDRIYALRDSDKIIDLMGPRQWNLAIQQHRCIATDEGAGVYLVNLPQRDRMALGLQYLLICEDQIIVLSQAADPTKLVIEYISPDLIGRLDELTPFLREAFSNGGVYMSGKFLRDTDRSLGARKEFLLLQNIALKNGSPVPEQGSETEIKERATPLSPRPHSKLIEAINRTVKYVEALSTDEARQLFHPERIVRICVLPEELDDFIKSGKQTSWEGLSPEAIKVMQNFLAKRES